MDDLIIDAHAHCGVRGGGQLCHFRVPPSSDFLAFGDIGQIWLHIIPSSWSVLSDKYSGRDLNLERLAFSRSLATIPIYRGFP